VEKKNTNAALWDPTVGNYWKLTGHTDEAPTGGTLEGKLEGTLDEGTHEGTLERTVEGTPEGDNGVGTEPPTELVF
jgi:hypothetical protein